MLDTGYPPSLRYGRAGWLLVAGAEREGLEIVLNVEL